MTSWEPDSDSTARHDPYRELFERSADAILIIDGDTFVDCNQATVEMLRYRSKEELLRTHPSELSPPTQPDGRASREKADEMIATAFDRGSHRFEWTHVRADGEVFPVEVLLTAVRREGRPILHVVWRDLTDRKRLEEQLRHTQKMEAIGRLAGGIAHDFNNLLVAMVGNADLLVDSLANDDALRATAEEILAAGERATVLVRQLLTFSRKQDRQPAVVDLNDVLTGVHSLLVRLLGEHVELEIQTSGRPLPIHADPSQLELVVINLATNARDAMDEGGVVFLGLEEATVSRESVATVERLPEGRYAVLVARDDGRGIDLDSMDRIFDPFFTTKEVGKGTGLGLATVFGIAKQHGGSVGVASSPGTGTEMRVYLPITDVPSIPRAPEARASGDLTGTETVLVVEDEPSVAALVTTALRSRGYTVLSATTGREALRIWRDSGGRIDLILSDVIMPEMSGPQLVRALRELDANPLVVFMSGYTDNAMAALESIDEPVDLLTKPFTARTVTERVRRALDVRNDS